MKVVVGSRQSQVTACAKSKSKFERDSNGGQGTTLFPGLATHSTARTVRL